MDYSTLTLGDVMIHQVRKDRVKGQPEFIVEQTDIPIEMTNDVRRKLTDRFIEALLKRAFKVVADEEITDGVMDLVEAYWNEESDVETDLISASKTMSERLKEVQPFTSGSGLLVVADATVEGSKQLLISKVEHQQAMQATPSKNDLGQRVISMVQINDLVFGDHTKIYKVALLSLSGDSDETDVSGQLADSQNGPDAAQFFLRRFLGMKLFDAPDVVTKRYMDVMSNAINKIDLTPSEKIDARTALNVELKNNQATLDPDTFIRNHVPRHRQREVRDFVESRGVNMAPFSKDNARIANQVERLRISLDDDIYIVAPAEEIGSAGKIRVKQQPAAEDGTQLVTIEIAPTRLEQVENNGRR